MKTIIALLSVLILSLFHPPHARAVTLLLDPSPLQPLIQNLSAKYKINPFLAEEIINYAVRYAYPDFPRPAHILAIISIESRFNLKAKNKGSYGLMQVLTKTHRARILDRNSVEDQIRVGAGLLRTYYLESGSKDRAAIMSFNVGPGAYQRGARPKVYWSKYSRSLTWFSFQLNKVKLV